MSIASSENSRLKNGTGFAISCVVPLFPSRRTLPRDGDGAKDFAHFLSLARGSLNEVSTQLELAVRLGYLDSGSGLYEESQAIRKMLNAMIQRLKESPNT